MFNNLMTGTNRVLDLKPQVLNKSINYGIGSKYIFNGTETTEGVKGIAVELFTVSATIKNIDKLVINLDIFNGDPEGVLPPMGVLPFMACIKIHRKSIYKETYLVIENQYSPVFDLKTLFNGTNLHTDWELSLTYYTPVYSDPQWRSYLFRVLTSFDHYNYNFMDFIDMGFYHKEELNDTIQGDDLTPISWNSFQNKYHYYGNVNVTNTNTPVGGTTDLNKYWYKASMESNPYLNNDIYNTLLSHSPSSKNHFEIEYKYTYYDSETGEYETHVRSWYISSLPSTTGNYGVVGGNTSLDGLQNIDNYQVVILSPDDSQEEDLVDYLVLILKVNDNTTLE